MPQNILAFTVDYSFLDILISSSYLYNSIFQELLAVAGPSGSHSVPTDTEDTSPVNHFFC